MTQQKMRQRAIAWAREVVQEANFVILDTETTAMRGEVIDIAILSPSGEVVLDTLIKPLGAIEEGAQRVHGITEAMVQEALAFPQIWPQIYEILSKVKRVITYNASFDAERLQYTARRNVIRTFLEHPHVRLLGDSLTEYVVKARWECLMEWYADYHGQLSHRGDAKWQRLNEACQQMGIQHTNWHRALGDAQAAHKLLVKLAECEEGIL